MMIIYYYYDNDDGIIFFFWLNNKNNHEKKQVSRVLQSDTACELERTRWEKRHGVETKDETLSAQHACDQCAFEAQKDLPQARSDCGIFIQ